VARATLLTCQFFDFDGSLAKLFQVVDAILGSWKFGRLLGGFGKLKKNWKEKFEIFPD